MCLSTGLVPPTQLSLELLKDMFDYPHEIILCFIDLRTISFCDVITDTTLPTRWSRFWGNGTPLRCVTYIYYNLIWRQLLRMKWWYLNWLLRCHVMNYYDLFWCKWSFERMQILWLIFPVTVRAGNITFTNCF